MTPDEINDVRHTSPTQKAEAAIRKDERALVFSEFCSLYKPKEGSMTEQRCSPVIVDALEAARHYLDVFRSHRKETPGLRYPSEEALFNSAATYADGCIEEIDRVLATLPDAAATPPRLTLPSGASVSVAAACKAIDFCDWLSGYIGHGPAVQIDSEGMEYIRSKVHPLIAEMDARSDGAAQPSTEGK
jgi:hypothetical protein